MEETQPPLYARIELLIRMDVAQELLRSWNRDEGAPEIPKWLATDLFVKIQQAAGERYNYRYLIQTRDKWLEVYREYSTRGVDFEWEKAMFWYASQHDLFYLFRLNIIDRYHALEARREFE